MTLCWNKAAKLQKKERKKRKRKFQLTLATFQRKCMQINFIPKCQGILFRMDNVSKFPYFSVFLFVIHIGEVSILRSNRKSIITTSYEVHHACPITILLREGENNKAISNILKRQLSTILNTFNFVQNV